jgi:hypothetical protein
VRASCRLPVVTAVWGAKPTLEIVQTGEELEVVSPRAGWVTVVHAYLHLQVALP